MSPTRKPIAGLAALACSVLISSLLAPPAAAQNLQEPQTQETAPAAVSAETPTQPAPSEATPGQVALPADAAPGPDQESTYTIKEGDTLWDISNSFLRDPFLWPLIWQVNPYITNPDLIYPGKPLRIPSLAPIERAISAPGGAPAEQAVEEPRTAPAARETAATPQSRDGIETLLRRLRSVDTTQEEYREEMRSKLILPEEGRTPLVDKYVMISAGFVNSEETDDVIVGAVEGKSIFGYDDVLFVRIRSQQAKIGDKFVIYEPKHNVRHPISRENFGRLIKIQGILEIIEDKGDGLQAARITLSFDASGIDSKLTPYQEPTLIYPNGAKRQKDLSGFILEVTDRRTINAQVDIVYLDKGSADGVEPGDRFVVYAEPRPREDTAPKPTGEIQVFLVKERTATAVVRKSNDVMERGDRIEFKN